mmetsp:Transcript_6560/g.23113  ORF Transcript_6560/g.23113 Transcript_6560/m.23113 type:complete len:111 (+) Transcript_6560:1190-1522(+)
MDSFMETSGHMKEYNCSTNGVIVLCGTVPHQSLPIFLYSLSEVETLTVGKNNTSLERQKSQKVITRIPSMHFRRKMNSEFDWHLVITTRNVAFLECILKEPIILLCHTIL